MTPVKRFQLENNLLDDGIIGKYTFSKMLDRFGLDKNQLSNFLGQCHYETEGFTRTEENLNYSRERLLEIFPTHFNKLTAEKYEHKSADIGNIVYANRMGNGDVSSGDGYKFRGRGGLNTTGRENYFKFSDYIGLDCIENYDYLKDKFFFDSALFYFKKGSILLISQLVDNVSICKLTKLINGGLNGLNGRIKNTVHYNSILK